MSVAELVSFAQEQDIELVGIGAMTRMVSKAYRVADGFRAAGIKVVMVDRDLNRTSRRGAWPKWWSAPRGTFALGEADRTWPLILPDAARGELKDIYQPSRRQGERYQTEPAALSRYPGSHSI